MSQFYIFYLQLTSPSLCTRTVLIVFTWYSEDDTVDAVQSQHSFYPINLNSYGSESGLNIDSQAIYVPERAGMHNTAILNEPPPDYNDL